MEENIAEKSFDELELDIKRKRRLPFLKYEGQKCTVTTANWYNPSRKFFQTGVITSVTLDFLYLDTPKGTVRIPINEIRHVRRQTDDW